MSTITEAEFRAWLRGFLEGRRELNEDAIERIRTEMARVVPMVAPAPFVIQPFGSPPPWDATPARPPIPPYTTPSAPIIRWTESDSTNFTVPPRPPVWDDLVLNS